MASAQPARLDVALGIECDRLPERVHAGIGAARAAHLGCARVDRVHCAVELAGDGASVGLPRETGERRAVVGNREQHGAGSARPGRSVAARIGFRAGRVTDRSQAIFIDRVGADLLDLWVGMHAAVIDFVDVVQRKLSAVSGAAVRRDAFGAAGREAQSRDAEGNSSEMADDAASLAIRSVRLRNEIHRNLRCPRSRPVEVETSTSGTYPPRSWQGPGHRCCFP